MGGRHCCVPGCKSNYKLTDKYIPVFCFPADEERKKLWLRNIHRLDFNPTKLSAVCINHFSDQFILHEASATRPDGTLVSYKLKKLALTKDAYPTIFDGQPSYLSSEPPAKRRVPDERRAAIEIQNEITLKTFEAKDEISSLLQIKNELHKRIDNKVWFSYATENFVTIFKNNFDELPCVTICIKIYSDLSVDVWHQNTKLQYDKFNWILGDKNTCNKWSKFDKLIDHFHSYSETSCCIEDKLSYAIKILKRVQR